MREQPLVGPLNWPAPMNRHAESASNATPGDADVWSTGYEAEWCGDRETLTKFLCSRLSGHAGRHVAGDGTQVIAAWHRH